MQECLNKRTMSHEQYTSFVRAAPLFRSLPLMTIVSAVDDDPSRVVLACLCAFIGDFKHATPASSGNIAQRVWVESVWPRLRKERTYVNPANADPDQAECNKEVCVHARAAHACLLLYTCTLTHRVYLNSFDSLQKAAEPRMVTFV